MQRIESEKVFVFDIFLHLHFNYSGAEDEDGDDDDDTQPNEVIDLLMLEHKQCDNVLQHVTASNPVFRFN